MGVTYAPEIPPSTRNVEAVMKDASSLARNATAAAISSGSAKRPIGTWTIRRAARSGSFAKSSCRSGVLTGPGQRAFTLMPSLANCTPSSRDNASTPPLEAVYEILRRGRPEHGHKRGRVDYRTLPGALHIRDNSLTAKVDGGEIDLLDPSPGVKAGREYGVVLGRRNASIIESNVDAPVRLVSHAVHSLDVANVADVGADGQPVDFFGSRLGGVVVYVCYDDARAFHRQAAHRGQADTTTAAGDDRNLSFEATACRLCHGPCSEAFKTADPFPVGDSGVEGVKLDVCRVEVVLYDGLAERTQRDFALLQQLRRLPQIGR